MTSRGVEDDCTTARCKSRMTARSHYLGIRLVILHYHAQPSSHYLGLVQKPGCWWICNKHEDLQLPHECLTWVAQALCASRSLPAVSASAFYPPQCSAPKKTLKTPLRKTLHRTMQEFRRKEISVETSDYWRDYLWGHTSWFCWWLPLLVMCNLRPPEPAAMRGLCRQTEGPALELWKP